MGKEINRTDTITFLLSFIAACVLAGTIAISIGVFRWDSTRNDASAALGAASTTLEASGVVIREARGHLTTLATRADRMLINAEPVVAEVRALPLREMRTAAQAAWHNGTSWSNTSLSTALRDVLSNISTTIRSVNKSMVEDWSSVPSGQLLQRWDKSILAGVLLLQDMRALLAARFTLQTAAPGLARDQDILELLHHNEKG